MYSEIPEPNNIPITNNTTPASAAEVEDEDIQASQTADGSTASTGSTFRTFIWLLAGVVVRLAITSRFATYIQVTFFFKFINKCIVC